MQYYAIDLKKNNTAITNTQGGIMSDNESKSVAPITLTAEQVISLVGHGVTQEQLDSARRELGEKMDNQDTKFDIKFDKLDAKFDAKFDQIDKKFDAKFDQLDKKIDTKFDQLDKKFDAKFDRLDDKIDKKFNLILGFLLASTASIVALGFWLGQNVVK